MEKNKTYDCLSREISIDIAVTTRAIEISSWQTPFGWIWLSGSDIGWNLVARKEPDSDECRGPVHSIKATTILVEGSSVRVGASFDRTSSTVAKLTVHVTIVESTDFCGGRGIECTGISGVEGGEGLSDVVGALENIDLTVWTIAVTNGPASKWVSDWC